MKRILTGDRPTGKLHIGHYVGSLKNRVKLQDEYDQFVMIADVQALTDNYDNPEKVHDNVYQLILDYLAVGLDPAKTTIFIQSMIPQIAELTVFYMNLVTVNRLLRNPTVKSEIAEKGLEESVPVGFLAYPVSQAADITAFGGELVPVGEDQLPQIEQTKEIVRRFNNIYGETLKEPEALLSDFPRLIGLDGGSKMSKSLGNTINLGDGDEEIRKKIKGMYTDPNRIHATDPGKVEGNPVFIYLDAFGTIEDKEQIDDYKKRYREGGVGDSEIKIFLGDVMCKFIKPIRERREAYEAQPEKIQQILKEGTERALLEAEKTLSSVKKAMKLNYFV